MSQCCVKFMSFSFAAASEASPSFVNLKSLSYCTSQCPGGDDGGGDGGGGGGDDVELMTRR